jgi:hypothetical protein
VEASAVARFTPPDGPLSHLTGLSSAIVPKLLYHNPEEHVLVIEDLGPLETLQQHFLGIRDGKPFHRSVGDESYRKLGSRIGEFFGRLHSPESRELVKAATFNGLDKSLVKDLLLQEAVMSIQKHLAQFNIPNAELLF